MADIIPIQWDSPEFDAIRQTIRNRFACSEEEAIARLQAMWNHQEDKRPPSPGLVPQPIPDPIPNVDPPLPPRKKTAFTDFDVNSSIPEHLPFFPAQFATDKVKSMDYVELWYFTSEGITDASKTTPTATDDTFGLLRTDSGLALQQIKATRASRNVIADEYLTWDQISTARHNILNAAAGWPDKHRIALAEFFMNLESLKATGTNPRYLIAYQAVSRRLWHSALKGPGHPFNIANINQALMLKLENQIRDADHTDLRGQASNTSFRNLTSTLTPPPLCYFHPTPHITPYCATPHHATPRYATPRNATPHHATPHMLCHTMPQHTNATPGPLESWPHQHHSLRLWHSATVRLKPTPTRQAGDGTGDGSTCRLALDLLDLDPQRTSHRPHGFGSTSHHPKRPSSPRAQYASAERNIPSATAKPLPCGTANTRLDAPAPRMDASLMNLAAPYATIGTRLLDARTKPHGTSTNVQDAGNRLMELRIAVSQRRLKPLTPLVADEWDQNLRAAHLLGKYNQIPMFIRHGALAGIPQIPHSFTPLNKESTMALPIAFNEIVQAEFTKGRYIGPFSKEELEDEIGSFQSSPLSLVPKAGKPGKYRLIQNLSHPHTNTPVPSINTRLKADDFPCTWGTFRTICTLIRGLPSGSQAAVRDIAEAYRIIPLHESQWPGVVVRISNNPERFALNTCNSFGCSTAGGLFGLFGDALADLLRAKGVGPILKWVDDFIFIRIPRETIPSYNKSRQRNRDIVTDNGGKVQTGGRLWYKGKLLEDVGNEHFAEDLSFPLRTLPGHHNHTSPYPYDIRSIDKITEPLGIPWESSKDIPFGFEVPFIGFLWDLENKKVSLSEAKKQKYLCAIVEWNTRKTHNLEDVRRLYGKLLYTSLILPRGRAYLTGLEKMMGFFHDRPFSSRHPPNSLVEDLTWWSSILSSPTLSRDIPGGRQIIDIHGFSDASSTIGIGVVIGGRWRAWRLLPNWKSGGRDIGWAEAVGMELLLRIALTLGSPPGILLHGDNTGVVEGWWSGRSRNVETNRVFRRIHEMLENSNSILVTRYVNTNRNPADGPSRGIYPHESLLLPPVRLPDEIHPFVVDFDAPTQLCERLSPQRPPPVPKATVPPLEHIRRQQATAAAQEQHSEPVQEDSFD